MFAPIHRSGNSDGPLRAPRAGGGMRSAQGVRAFMARRCRDVRSFGEQPIRLSGAEARPGPRPAERATASRPPATRLAPARGVLLGVGLSLLLWAALVALGAWLLG
jgi:hypothetical protein